MSRRFFLIIAALIILVSSLIIYFLSYNLQKNSPESFKSAPQSQGSKGITIYSPDRDIKVFVPVLAAPNVSSFQLAETLLAANLKGYKNFRTIGLFGYGKDGKYVYQLDGEITLEYPLPVNFDAYDKAKNTTYVYSIEKPVVFLYGKDGKWKEIDSQWDKQSRKLTVRTKIIGTFAFSIPEDGQKTIKTIQ